MDLLQGELLIALLTLSTLEIVLGVDNLVFISIAVGRLPHENRSLARRLGIGFACLTRIGLLLVLAHLARLDDRHAPLFHLGSQIISIRDLIMTGGGLFLLVKGAMEIHETIYGVAKQTVANTTAAAFAWVVVQIALIDIVFSLDSVITAVGMVRNIPVMVAAIVLAVIVMLFASDPVGNFIDNNPTIRMLALAFIMMIGVMLVGEGFAIHIPRGYIYFAMAFSAVVEALNLAVKRQKKKYLKQREGDTARETL
ncbi:MAG: TerC family protein [Xanthomonadales bacterium PRO7]|mgnify:CR=1 FL=1|jgi:predicted tellurium resistance membrane protein TerC|nr:TerC family protein [Xanthomonadales bacterium PRO7]HMM56588.1 TerC family protein [Rudaea sp.]